MLERLTMILYEVKKLYRGRTEEILIGNISVDLHLKNKLEEKSKNI